MLKTKESVSFEEGEHTVPISVTLEFNKIYLGSIDNDGPFAVFVSYKFKGFPYSSEEFRDSHKKLLITSALEIARAYQHVLGINIPENPKVDLYGQQVVGISLR